MGLKLGMQPGWTDEMLFIIASSRLDIIRIAVKAHSAGERGGRRRLMGSETGCQEAPAKVARGHKQGALGGRKGGRRDHLTSPWGSCHLKIHVRESFFPKFAAWSPTPPIAARKVFYLVKKTHLIRRGHNKPTVHTPLHTWGDGLHDSIIVRRQRSECPPGEGKGTVGETRAGGGGEARRQCRWSWERTLQARPEKNPTDRLWERGTKNPHPHKSNIRTESAHPEGVLEPDSRPGSKRCVYTSCSENMV